MIESDQPRQHLVIELVRAAEVTSASGVASGEWNRYLLRDPDGSGRYEEGELLWDESMQAELSACSDFASAGEAVGRMAEIMRAFVNSAGWQRIAERIQTMRATGRPLAITVRSAAHELYTLPWEFLDLAGTALCQTDCLLCYEWPAQAGAGALAPPRAGGRVLLAWSAAGGGVPAAEHIGAMAAATRAGKVPFDATRDVLANASAASLETALRDSETPVTILHLLCHSEVMPGGSAYGLRLDGAAAPVSPDRMRALLAPYRDTLRLVVVSACLGSNPGAADNALGSVAQAIHEAGVPAVIASRYPLSVAGSVLSTRRLYQRLFVDLWSLEQAFLDARAGLRDRDRGPGEPRDLDWAAIQLFRRADLGQEFRPWIIRPYRGLESYGREHERFFFGREQERRQLCDRVAAALAGGAPRFLLVAGASGTGKSSLALAGLATDLEAGRMIAGDATGHAWSTVVMRPAEGGAPSEILARRLDERRPRPGNSDARSMTLLVVDQLEELFTSMADPAQQAAFLRTIWQLASEPGGDVFVVATIRIEYLGRFGNVCIDEAGVPFDHEMLAGERHYLVRQMGPEQRERVICGPAEATGVRLEPGLLGRLQAALRAEPGALPLLSYTLDRLWQQRSFGTLEILRAGERMAVTGWWLTDRAYDELGGVEGALANTADALFARLGPAHQDELRRVLVQLVHAHEDPMLATRRRGWRLALRPDPAAEAGAARVFDETVDALVAARLLVQGSAGDEGAEPWIELAHDSLIRLWPRLSAWHREAREWLAHTGELREMAMAWQPHARRDDGPRAREAEEPYLLRGHRLSHHLEMWQRHGHHLGARDRKVVQEFLDACARAENERRAESLARERAARRRTRVITLSAVVVAVVMSILGLWAFGQQRRAEEKTAEAEQQRKEAVKERDAKEQQRIIAEDRAIAARDASLMAGAHVLLGGNESIWAARLLSEVARPDAVERAWRPQAIETLASIPLRSTRAGNAGDVFSHAAFSPDGRYILFLTKIGAAWLWRTDGKGRAVGLREEAGYFVSHAAFSPHGQRVVIAFGNDTAEIWRTDRTDTFKLLEGHNRYIRSVAFSPDGTLVVTASDDKTARVWRADDGTLVSVLEGHAGGVASAAFSPDGLSVVTASRDRTARIWPTGGGKPLAVLQHTEPVSQASFSPDGRYVLTTSVDHKVHVWPAGGTRAPVELSWHEGPVSSAVFSPDGTYVVTASSDGTARLGRADGNGEPVVLRGHSSGVDMAAFSPDGRQLVTASADGTVRIWLASEQRELAMRRGSWAAFSKDGRFLLAASPDGGAQVWNADGAGSQAEILHASLQDVGSLWQDEALDLRRDCTMTFDAGDTGSDFLLTKSSDNRVIAERPDATDKGTGKPIVLGYTMEITGTACSPDRTLVVAGGRDNKARVWRADGTGEPIVLGEHEAEVIGVAFSPDGKLVATGSRDKKVRLWRADGTGEPIVLGAHEDEVTGVAFSPDGKLVVTGSFDHTARVWRADGADEPIVLRGHGQPVVLVAFARDGQHVVTASMDGTVRKWPIGIEALRARLAERSPRCLPVELRRTYLGESEAEARSAFDACEQ